MSSMISHRNIEEAWKSFIQTIPPHADSNRAGQVAAIVRGRMEGLKLHALMMNLINKYSMQDEEVDDTLVEIDDDELDIKWMNILRNTPPVYGDPRADQVREIMQLENAGIDVDILITNMTLGEEHNTVIPHTMGYSLNTGGPDDCQLLGNNEDSAE